MIEVDVKINDLMTNQLLKIRKELQQVPVEGLKEFKALTPIDTGNARRKTMLQGDTIKANYPYAERLDKGHSKQAPQGMTKPFEKWFNRRIKQIMGN